MKKFLLTLLITLLSLTAWSLEPQDSHRTRKGKTARVSISHILKGTPVVNAETGQVTANIEKSSKVYELQKGEEASIFVAEKVGKESITLKTDLTLMDLDTQRKGTQFELKKGKLVRLTVCDLLDATETYTLLCEDVW